MNDTARGHCETAKAYVEQGDEFYRRAKPEIEAAIANGASVREVSRFLDKSKTWVNDVVRWDGTGTLYGDDTERRQRDMARQVLRDSPIEEVERIVQDLPTDRRHAVIGALVDTHPSRMRPRVGTGIREGMEDLDRAVGFLMVMSGALSRLTDARRQVEADWNAHVESAHDDDKEVVAERIQEHAAALIALTTNPEEILA